MSSDTGWTVRLLPLSFQGSCNSESQCRGSLAQVLCALAPHILPPLHHALALPPSCAANSLRRLREHISQLRPPVANAFLAQRQG